jgi:hypothetical protein
MMVPYAALIVKNKRLSLPVNLKFGVSPSPPKMKMVKLFKVAPLYVERGKVGFSQHINFLG